jgi:hypothetical protein
MKEYRTTWAVWRKAVNHYDDYCDEIVAKDPPMVPDPIAPIGAGWNLVGSAADDHFLFWFWERSVPPVQAF